MPAQTPASFSTTPKLTGYIQARFQSISDSAVFPPRRARIGARGNLTPGASYRVQAELRSGGTGATASTVAATDLSLALTHHLWTATIGQSKTPLSVEFIRSSTVLELPERSMAVDSLSPNRDVGVKLEWNTAGTLTLQGGVFNGDGINRAANRDKRFLYVTRAVVRAGTDRITGYTVGAQYFLTGDDLKLQLEYTAFTEQGTSLDDNRVIVQMQARW